MIFIVTIKDVAGHAGVSKTLVSRFINNQVGVSEASKQKIIEAIKALNYSPNAIARSLVLQQTGIIGVVVDDLCSPFLYNLIKGIEQGLHSPESKYDVIFCNSNGDSETKSKHITSLTQGRVDGLIIYGSFVTDDDLIKKLINTNFPVVLIENDVDYPDIEKVVIDNHTGAFEATQYLINSGHRKIHHITGNLNIKVTTDRLTGFTDAMQKNMIEIDKNFINFPDFNEILKMNHHDEFSYKSEFFMSGYIEMKKIITAGDLPDAIFFATDMAAFGAIKAMDEVGLRVPEDISIIGFDDENPSFCGYYCPLISTVKQPLKEAGKIAVNRLIKIIENPQIKKLRTLLKTKLVIRNSVIKNSTF